MAGSAVLVENVRVFDGHRMPNFKTWRILHTDYRRSIATFTETISTVVALHFYAYG